MEWLLNTPMFAPGSVWRLVSRGVYQEETDSVWLVFQLIDAGNPGVLVTLSVALVTFRVEVNTD